MSDWNWSDTAELIQMRVSGKGWTGNRKTASVMKASVSEIVAHLRAQNIDDIWRFAIAIEGGRYLRAADLREALRDPGCPR